MIGAFLRENSKKLSMNNSRVKTLERLDYFHDKDKVAINLSMRNYNFCQKFSPEDSEILDLGCGFGWGTDYLSQKGRCVGVDINRKTIEEARKRYGRNKKVKFVVADALRLPFKNEQFDVVVSIENIEHVNDQRKYIEEAKRVLKKGGLLIVSTPNGEHFGHRLRKLVGVKQHGNPFHLHEFSEDELAALLEDDGFRIIKKKRALFILPITVLSFIERNNLLMRLVTAFTLPGFNTDFLTVACKK